MKVENLKAYIESGVLELYVLGDVSPDEKLQVEDMALKHPSVRAELDEIERTLELLADENAIAPPENLRSRTLNSLLTNFGDDRTFGPQAGDTKGGIIALQEPKQVNYYKYAFAACLALLITSSLWVAALYNRLQQSNVQIAALQNDKEVFARKVNFVEGQLQVFEDASFKFLKLQGTAKDPSAQLTVAWSPARKKVWIDMRGMKMPVNDKAHQYQLWALVAGKPVDLGVFDKTADTSYMKEMKPVAYAEAFAVTLEPRGGSLNPTMDEMMVLGKF